MMLFLPQHTFTACCKLRDRRLGKLLEHYIPEEALEKPEKPDLKRDVSDIPQNSCHILETCHEGRKENSLYENWP